MSADQGQGPAREPSKPVTIDGPDAERLQGDDEGTAKDLPSYTPQGRAGDSPDDPSLKNPGFTPQGRADS